MSVTRVLNTPSSNDVFSHHPPHCLHLGWTRHANKLPADTFFRPDLAEGFIRFAKEHAMFLQWADFDWMPFSPWDKETPNYTEQVKALLRQHPGIVTVIYNNNDPNEGSIPRLSTWHTAVAHFPKDGAAGYGLSNQS